MAFTFATMTEGDLVVLHRWLEQPHVREFYDREPRTFAEVAARYRRKVRGEEPTRPFIASLEGIAIGYLQTYRVAIIRTTGARSTPVRMLRAWTC